MGFYDASTCQNRQLERRTLGVDCGQCSSNTREPKMIEISRPGSAPLALWTGASALRPMMARVPKAGELDMGRSKKLRRAPKWKSSALATPAATAILKLERISRHLQSSKGLRVFDVRLKDVGNVR